MRWCRLYAEFATDPKVQIMPEPMQRRLIMLFCFQAEGSLESMDDETLGFAMHLSTAELQKTKELFVKKGFLEPGTWIPRNWDKRQRSSDTSNERVSRYRERVKRESNGAVTLQKLKSSDSCNEISLCARERAPAPSHSLSVSVSEGGPGGNILPPSKSETGRTGLEHAKFVEAWDLLRSHTSTLHLAEGLSMAADTPEIRAFEPWRLWVGATVAQRPNKSKDWNSFLGYCRKATTYELQSIQAEKSAAKVESTVQFHKAPAEFRDSYPDRKP